MGLQYALVGTEDGSSSIVVFVQGRAPQVAHSSHPNFEDILRGVQNQDESVLDLFDVAQTAATRFERLSERVTVANGRVYLDGEEVDNSLTQQVARFIREDQDFMPLVLFFENVQSNPNEHSREQLFTWLNDRDFTITDEGMLVAYKSVQSDGNGGFQSISSGRAIVDGEQQNGRIAQQIGSVVEMPRGEVAHDPSVGCHTGLHVGTYEYAESFSGDTMLEVHVNPRDVVSVPTDCNAQKVRTCRYTVVDVIDKPYSVGLVSVYDEGDDDDWGWGDGETDDDPGECEDCGTELYSDGYCPECDY